MLVFFIAIIAVALFVLALSITLIYKGRPMQGDVGDNDDMKRMGLECTSRTALAEEAALRGEVCPEITGCGGSLCSSCNPKK